MMTTYRRIIIALLIFVAVSGTSFLAGTYVGYEKRLENEALASFLPEDTSYEAPDVDFRPYWQVWNLIDEKYVFEDGPSQEEKLWGSIKGLVNSIDDPYSAFLPPQESQTFEENISGEFGGVGIEIGMRDDVLTVISPIEGTPASEAGLQSEDRIIAVDGEPTTDFSIDDAVSRIRGEIGTTVTLTVLRSTNGTQERLDIDVTRDTIEIPTLETDTREGVRIIELHNFSAPASEEFQSALIGARDDNVEDLIIDLRNNPGGYLQSAIEMASLLMPEGKVVVREDFGQGRDDRVHRSTSGRVFEENPDIVVLVNGGSASASEILAAALREHAAATVMGTETFGKGSVQELVPVTDDSSLKITVAKWLTPDGTVLEGNGITPDTIVDDDPETEDDEQLLEALSVITSD